MGPITPTDIWDDWSYDASETESEEDVEQMILNLKINAILRSSIVKTEENQKT